MKSEWSEKVFDSFLEEVVTGQHPPDLSARIAAAWQRQCADELGLRAANASAVGAEQRLPEQRSRAFYSWSAVLFVAASIVLVVASLQLRHLLPSFKDDNSSLANSANQADSIKAPPSEGKQAVPSNEIANGGETLPLEGVPFAAQDPSRDGVEEQKKPATSSSVNRLKDREIVELIDTQLAGLWNQLNLVPANRESDEDLSQALSRVLTGQDLPVAEAAKLTLLDSEQRRERVIAIGFESNVFARRWADKFVGRWLQGGILPLDSAPVEKLQQFVASGISDERPWNEVITQVVAGDAAAGDAFELALAGGGNHRLASKIGSQLMDTSLACARCHASTNSGSLVQSQQEYWSLVALLVGLDVEKVDGSAGPKSVDKQATLFAAAKKPTLYFDRPNGTLEEATFVLPDGQPWESIGGKTPRTALAKWLGQSEQADRAAVDQVWQIVFGRPLVGSNPLLNDVGLAEREDLLKLMAQQFRAHGHNLSQLVGWVIRSDAFSRSEIALDQSRWLQATDKEFSQWHVAEMTFAAKTSLGNPTATGGSGLEGSLAAALKWNQTAGVDTRVLAQPNLNPNANPNAQVKSDIVMPAPSYVLHRGRISATQQAFLDRLLSSKNLNWKEKVEHVVSLSPGLATNENVVKLAEELAAQKNSRAALVELLWAVQNADAS